MRKASKRRSERLRRKQRKERAEAIRQAASRLTMEPASAHPGVTPLPDALNGGAPSAIKRRFKVGWRVLSLLIVGVLSYAVYIAWRSPEYRVSGVQVSGLQRISQENVLSQINLTGQHIFAVTPDEIRQTLSHAFPEFRDIRVFINLPAQVSIRVAERQPQIAWRMEEDLLWIDSEGYLIPARGESGPLLTIQADSFPAYNLKTPADAEGTTKVVRDKAPVKPNPSSLAFFAQAKQIDGALLTAILQLNAWMPQEETLLYQRQRGLGWADVRGWDVYVGQKLEKINEKMVMYETIVRELEKEGVSPAVVSVEFLHAPYYRTD